MRNKLRWVLRLSIPAFCAVVIVGLILWQNGPGWVEEMQVYAVAHNGVPTETVACKTARSCYQRQLQKDWQAQQKLRMKAFQADQKARFKALYKPQQRAISTSRDLSANEKKTMLKSLAELEKEQMKAEMQDFKATQKEQNQNEKGVIKELVKNCGC